jgi:hypothetical protein
MISPFLGIAAASKTSDAAAASKTISEVRFVVYFNALGSTPIVSLAGL